MSLNPGKIYYSISEVCEELSLEQHVLRYWENEFSQLRPKKNRAGNRAYRKKDITLIRFIKYLLHEELFTIQGARKKLAGVNFSNLGEGSPAEHFNTDSQLSLFESELTGESKESIENRKLRRLIGELKKDMSELKSLFDSPPPGHTSS
ncbi:MAG: MerR family transcriptional regulator [Fibrobacterota bacterium]